jgi:glycosyltransferase involved in cell wall biosynthesis
MVVKAHAEVDFLIAGSWWGDTTRQEAEDCVASLGITEKVQFVGPVTGQQKSAFLHSGSLFVFPSIQQEGQPMTVLEAMSEGLPVIATDRGCLKETVVDGITGFIVPPNSPEAIAEKIIHLIHHPVLRDEMAANSLKRVEQCYTVEQFASRLEEAFRQTLVAEQRRNTRRARIGFIP